MALPFIFQNEIQYYLPGTKLIGRSEENCRIWNGYGKFSDRDKSWIIDAVKGSLRRPPDIKG